ncbi:MAG: hypothetical protein ACR2QJ_12225 [Geminicoccaceae bacterium]
MNVQFAKMISLFSAKRAGVASALVCALAATGVGAHGQSVDAPNNERQLSDDIVLAQHADDCGCDDDEDFSDFDEKFDREMDAEFADDVDDDEDYADDYGDERDEDYAEDHGDEPDDTQEPVLSAQERLDRNLDRQIQVIEKTILWRNPMGPGYF